MRKGPLYPCPCCGEDTIAEPGNFEICPLCMWEDDPIQSEEPDFDGGGNGVSLIDARKLWAMRQKDT